MGGYQAALGGGATGPGATQLVDLSVPPDVDPDGIHNAAGSSASSLRLNLSGSGHSSPARWHLRELADGETAMLDLKHGLPQGASKAWLGVGFVSDSGVYVAGINAHGGGNAHPLEFNGSAVSYGSIGTTEDVTWLSFHRRGSNMLIRGNAKFYDVSGTPAQQGTGYADIIVSGTVYLTAMAGLNDSSGGTVDIPYLGRLAVFPAMP